MKFFHPRARPNPDLCAQPTLPRATPSPSSSRTPVRWISGEEEPQDRNSARVCVFANRYALHFLSFNAPLAVPLVPHFDSSPGTVATVPIRIRVSKHKITPGLEARGGPSRSRPGQCADVRVRGAFDLTAESGHGAAESDATRSTGVPCSSLTNDGGGWQRECSGPAELPVRIWKVQVVACPQLPATCLTRIGTFLEGPVRPLTGWQLARQERTRFFYPSPSLSAWTPGLPSCCPIAVQ